MFYGVVAIVLGFIDVSWSLGWIVGAVVLVIIKWNRKRFYNQLFEMTSFNLGQFVTYSLILIGLMGGSFVLAFLVKTWVNPYTLFAAFFTERILNFFKNSLVKGVNQ